MILRQQKISKEFYRNFFSLYFVLVLQNVVTLSVNLTDNIMLGAYSETALSGVSAVNQIQFVFQQLVMALETDWLFSAVSTGERNRQSR